MLEITERNPPRQCRVIFNRRTDLGMIGEMAYKRDMRFVKTQEHDMEVGWMLE